MIHLGRGVVVKFNTLTDIECKSLIAICEDKRSNRLVNNRSNPKNTYQPGTSFTDVKLLFDNAPNLQKFIHNKICNAVEEYCTFQKIPFLGVNYEPPELMHFSVGQDKFHTHFDGNGKDCSRVLALVWYLNDVKEGGELHLPSSSEYLFIKPEKGKLAIIPTDWTHYHHVTTPVSNDRFSLITFIRL